MNQIENDCSDGNDDRHGIEYSAIIKDVSGKDFPSATSFKNPSKKETNRNTKNENSDNLEGASSHHVSNRSLHCSVPFFVLCIIFTL